MDLNFYKNNGYFFPIKLFEKNEIDNIYDNFQRIFIKNNKIINREYLTKSHLILPWSSEIIFNQSILDNVKSLLNSHNILCWSSTFFVKEPKKSQFVSWHQDIKYWGLKPANLVTVSLAITPSNLKTGCLNVISGTHKDKILNHKKKMDKKNLLSQGQSIDENLINKNNIVNLELKPGECSFHHPNIIHGSDKNDSENYRILFAIRYISSDVKQEANQYNTATLVSGQNSNKFFINEPIPIMEFGDKEINYFKNINIYQLKGYIENNIKSSLLKKVVLYFFSNKLFSKMIFNFYKIIRKYYK